MKESTVVGCMLGSLVLKHAVMHKDTEIYFENNNFCCVSVCDTKTPVLDTSLDNKR